MRWNIFFVAYGLAPHQEMPQVVLHERRSWTTLILCFSSKMKCFTMGHLFAPTAGTANCIVNATAQSAFGLNGACRFPYMPPFSSTAIKLFTEPSYCPAH